MRLLYEIGIRIYYLLIHLATLFNPKAKAFVKGRKGGVSAIRKKINSDQPLIWIHAASLGEFEQGRPIIEAIKKNYPHYKILLTFFSPSGYEVRKNYEQADYICYLPIDTFHNAKAFVSSLNIAVAIFVKYEFWHNYIYWLDKKNIPTFVVSAIFRPEQLFFKAHGKWFKKTLARIDKLFVQDVASLQLLHDHGIEQVEVIGDTRFDRVAEVVKNSPAIPLFENFCENSQVLVAGSTWEADEKLLLQYLQQYQQRPFKLILAPHEVNPQHIRSITKDLQLPYQLYSNANPETIKEAKILIIDTIGLLSSLYRYGQFAYIGGGFGAGIHNILEAATYGIPVVFGPNYKKFREAREMIAQQAARPISDYNQLEKAFNTFFDDNSVLKSSAKYAEQYIQNNLGATEKFMSYLFRIFVKQQ